MSKRITDTFDLLDAEVTPGNSYNRYGWLDASCSPRDVGQALLWSDEDEDRTGRDSSDLFGLPDEPISFSFDSRAADAPVVNLPCVSFLDLNVGVGGAEPTEAHAALDKNSFVDIEARARHAEARVRRVWDQLTGRTGAYSPFEKAAGGLMVLAVETERHVTPHTVRRRFSDGREAEMALFDIPSLHGALQNVWRCLTGGAPAADVLASFDEIFRPFNVPITLGAAQRALLRHCLIERDNLLPEARDAEADWHAAEFGLADLRAGVQLSPATAPHNLSGEQSNGPPSEASERPAEAVRRQLKESADQRGIVEMQVSGLSFQKYVEETRDSLGTTWIAAYQKAVKDLGNVPYRTFKHFEDARGARIRRERRKRADGGPLSASEKPDNVG